YIFINKFIILMIFVDNIIYIFYKLNYQKFNKFKQELIILFKFKDLKEINLFLNI
ncbi:hypothetical protein BO70DRAFT_303328, partial [Aspergillus heteromorphus CBS 117.55]